MRICIFTSNMDLVALDKKTLLSQMNCFLKENEVDEIYITSYQRPNPGVDQSRFYRLLWNHKSFRLRICRRLFQAIDSNRGVPILLSFIPLWLCQREVLEVLLGCDPDVIFIHDLRWGFQLRKLIHQHYPHWTCLTKPGQRLNVNLKWRRFNPSSKVSIILPTYNGSKYIRQSIESCLNQIFRNIELIVVDDGSSEDIQGLLTIYRDPRIKYIRHDKNLGLAEALNTGFKNSTGEYLTWTSDDNYYAENAIEEMVRFLQTFPEVDFVYADYIAIDDRITKDRSVYSAADLVITDDRGTGQDLRLHRNKPPEWLAVDDGVGACFLYKRKVYETIGDYNPRAFLAEDYDYWVRVSKEFRMQRLFRPLYYYRYHEDSLTSKYSREEVLKKVELVKQLNNI